MNPENLQTKPLGSDAVEMTWMDSNGFREGWELSYSPFALNASPKSGKRLASFDTNVVISGLNPETEYTFKLRAVSFDRASEGIESVVSTPPDYCSLQTAPSCNSGECVSTHKGAECQCAEGYYGDGVTYCLDVDECKDTVYPVCDQVSSTCENTVGSFKCECKLGFKKDANDRCVDVDECTEVVCAELTTCRNLLGSYECICLAGFISDSETGECVDLDECLSGDFVCANHAHCVNNYGSYMCDCNSGYVGHGMSVCTDFDECAMATHKCADADACENIEGGYRNFGK